MVYIKLKPNIVQQLKPYISQDKFVLCKQEYFISYPQFKRISLQHNLQIHQYLRRSDIITYNQMNLLLEREKQTPQQIRFIDELKRQRAFNFSKDGHINQHDGHSSFQNGQKNHTMDIKSFVLSTTFIFVFFVTGISGYIFGKHYLEWSYSQSLIVASVFIAMAFFIQIQFFKLHHSQNNKKIYFGKKDGRHIMPIKQINPLVKSINEVGIENKNK